MYSLRTIATIPTSSKSLENEGTVNLLSMKVNCCKEFRKKNIEKIVHKANVKVVLV